MITVKVYLYPQDNCQLISFCDARGHFHYMICNTDSSNNLLGLHISIIMVTHSFHSYRLCFFGAPSLEIVLVAKLMTQGRGKQQNCFGNTLPFFKHCIKMPFLPRMNIPNTPTYFYWGWQEHLTIVTCFFSRLSQHHLTFILQFQTKRNLLISKVEEST